MKNALLLLLSALTLSASATSYKGRIYEDKNQNGIYDHGEKVLSGVRVSDGLHVVKSDNNGLFNLAGHENAKFVFITTPSGYKTFNAYYRAVTSTSEDYNFGLIPFTNRIQKGGKHKFLHITDTEIRDSAGHEIWIKNTRETAKNEDAAFIIHTGDICYEGGLNSHIKLVNTKTMDCPVYYAIGNHDLVAGPYGEALFEKLYGPTYYSFDAGNTHYIVTPMPHGDYKPQYTTEEVAKWMKNDLAMVDPAKSVVAFNHDILTTSERFIYNKGGKTEVDLNAHNLKAWIYGHWHNHFIRKQGNVLAICTGPLDKGGIDHSTSAMRIINVDSKGDITTSLRYSYLNKSLQITSVNNGDSPSDVHGNTPLTANIYNSTSLAKKVTYGVSVDQRNIIRDQELKQFTDWSWGSNLNIPPIYTNRLATITVTAVFANGEVASTSESFIFKPGKVRTVTPSQNWTSLLKNAAHSGLSLDTLANNPRLSWLTNVGSNIYFASPLVADNKVFVATVDEDRRGEGGLCAMNASDGKIIWKYKTRSSIKNSITIDAGLVMGQDAEGYLYAVDAATGTLRWEKKLNVGPLPGLVDGITAQNGIVYAGSGKGFAAYKVSTGEMIWQNSQWPQREGTTSTITVGDGVAVSGAQWSGFYGNDVLTGKLLWSMKTDGITDRGGSPTIQDNKLYVVARTSLFIMDARSGKILTKKDLPFNVTVTTTPLITDKLIIFGTLNDGLVALNKETLETTWKAETFTSLVFTSPYTQFASRAMETSPVKAGNTIYFGASDGYLYAVNAHTGKLLWRHNAGAPFFNTLAVSGNTLFCADFGGNVYAFSGGVNAK